MPSLLSDLRYAWRKLFSGSGAAALAILSIGLGVGVSAAIFGAVDRILLVALPYPEPQRVTVIEQRTRDGLPRPMAYGPFVELEQRNRSFDALAVTRGWQPVARLGRRAGAPRRRSGEPRLFSCARSAAFARTRLRRRGRGQRRAARRDRDCRFRATPVRQCRGGAQPHDHARSRRAHGHRRHAAGIRERVRSGRRNLGAAAAASPRRRSKARSGASSCEWSDDCVPASRSTRRSASSRHSPLADSRISAPGLGALRERLRRRALAGFRHERSAPGAAGDPRRGAVAARDRVRERHEHTARARAREARRARDAGGARRGARAPRPAALRGERAACAVSAARSASPSPRS